MRNTNTNRTILANKVASDYDMKDLKVFKSFFINALKDEYAQNKDEFVQDTKTYMNK